MNKLTQTQLDDLAAAKLGFFTRPHYSHQLQGTAYLFESKLKGLKAISIVFKAQSKLSHPPVMCFGANQYGFVLY